MGERRGKRGRGKRGIDKQNGYLPENDCRQQCRPLVTQSCQPTMSLPCCCTLQLKAAVHGYYTQEEVCID